MSFEILKRYISLLFCRTLLITIRRLEILPHGAASNRIQLPWAGCFLAWPFTGTAGPLGGLGSKFQLVVNAKEEIDIEDLLDVSTSPENAYPTLEEPAGTKDAQVRAEREARDSDAIRV